MMPNSLVTVVISLFVLLDLETTEVTCCSVSPSAVAVVAGDKVTLTCSVGGKAYVEAWRVGNDSTNAHAVYQNATYDSNGKLIANSTIDDGFTLERSSWFPGHIMLTIHNVTGSHANFYFCICRSSGNPSAYVSVIVSEPTFTFSPKLTDDGRLILKCKVSYSGKGPFSQNITDVHGKVISSGTYSSNGTLHHEGTKYHYINARPTMNETFFCSNRLTDSKFGAILYEKVAVASVQRAPVHDVLIEADDPSNCVRDGHCKLNQTVHCIAEGIPAPDAFQWTISVNGKALNQTENTDIRLTHVGQHDIRCMAFNSVWNISYSASDLFRTQVTSGLASPGVDGIWCSLTFAAILGLGRFHLLF